MGGLSIDGLVSGLDTTNLVRQLIDLERSGQRRLQTRQADLRNTISNYTSLNDKFAALKTAAGDLADAADWQARTGSSSNEDVVGVSVTSGAVAGSLSFTVDSLAASHTLISGTAVAGKTAVVADGSDFTVNGVTVSAAEYGGGTLEEVVAAINGADAGVTAAAVQVSPGNYRLQLSAKDSGAAGTFTMGGTGLTGALGAFGIVSQGADAQITVGTGPAAYQLTSTTNSFADVLPGLTFDAKAVGSATVTVKADAEGLADKVQAMVDAMNGVRSFIATRQKYNPDTGSTGVFFGQSLPTSLRTKVQNAMIDPVSGSTLVGSGVGLQSDREGVVSFDRAKFLEAYAADPAAVEGFFSKNTTASTADDGMAERLLTLAEDTTRLNTGLITSFIDGRKNQIENLDDDIAAWDTRLEIREANLRRKFTNLETVLGRLQSQGQWLAGSLASLPKIGGGS